MADITYTKGNIIKAALHLMTSPEGFPVRVWDAYQILQISSFYGDAEQEFAELNSIFDNVCHDEIEQKLSPEISVSAAMIIFYLYEKVLTNQL
jgi:hypothetical protein